MALSDVHPALIRLESITFFKNPLGGPFTFQRLPSQRGVAIDPDRSTLDANASAGRMAAGGNSQRIFTTARRGDAKQRSPDHT